MVTHLPLQLGGGRLVCPWQGIRAGSTEIRLPSEILIQLPPGCLRPSSRWLGFLRLYVSGP